MVVSCLLDNPYFNEYELDEVLLQVAKALQNCDTNIDELYYFEPEKIRVILTSKQKRR